MKNLISLAVLVLVLSACGPVAQRNDQYSQNGSTVNAQGTQTSANTPVPTHYVMNSMSWTTTGGADLQYTITPSGTSFNVTVTRYMYQARNTSFLISASTSQSIAAFLTAIFSGQDGFVQSQYSSGFSGTYNSIDIIGRTGTSFHIASPVLYSNPNSQIMVQLYQLVISHL